MNCKNNNFVKKASAESGIITQIIILLLLIFAIGNDECTIDAITSQEIVCKTPPENGGSMSVYPGNAGLKYELWRNTGEIDTTAGWQIMNR